MQRSLWSPCKLVFASAILALGFVSPAPAGEPPGECVLTIGDLTADVATQHYPHINGTLVQVFFVKFPPLCIGQTGIFFEADGSTNPIFFQEKPCSNTLHAVVPINGADWNLVELLSSGPPWGPSACEAALGIF